MTQKKRVFKVLFHNQGTLYEVYARAVGQGELFGFVELEGLLFGEKSSLVVDPSEERLKAEFAGVSRTYVPLHAVVRIDEVEKEGAAKVIDISGKAGNVSVSPFPVYTPGGGPSKS